MPGQEQQQGSQLQAAAGSGLKPADLAWLALTALAYYAAARMSLAIAIPPGYATAVWPPSGIALASALLLGSRALPGICIAAFLANVAVEASVVSAALIAAGNSLEALIGAALIRRFVGERGAMERPEHVFRFIALAAVSACVAATAGVGSMALRHDLALAPALRNWWTWWEGDFTGIIVVAPLILSWSASGGAPWTRQKRLEAGAFFFLLIVAAAVISSEAASSFVPFSLTFVALPFILWAAFRFGLREVTSAIATVCGVALWYAVDQRQAFASLPLNELLLMLLTFIGMVVATGLTLATALDEQRRAAEVLRRKGAVLETELKQHAYHDSLVSERVAGRRSLESELRAALERREFVLHYQPQVEVDTRRVAALEALIRWRSPQRGLVMPLEFIPLLEETGLILEVGQWVVRRAVEDQGLWAAQGIEVPRVAVNVSALQLRQRDFVDSVRETLAGRYTVDIEITESCIMEEIDANIEKLRQLRGLGVRIAIDDFGTGYSSLAYLARLPVHTLKIDRGFIHRMLKDDETMAVVQTIIALAQSLNLATVAEGVESDAQADVLALLRCEHMQGHLIGMAQPPEALTELLKRGHA